MRRVELASSSASVVIDLDAGCRIASLVVAGHELLVTHGPTPIEWGSYPMAPWAGRVRNGRFRFDGRAYALPKNLGPHALHGTVFTAAWERESDRSFVTELTEPWPFGGRVHQSFDLAEDALSIRLEVAASNAMPASCGWHPWFRRSVGGSSADLVLDAGFMLARDEDGIATETQVPVPPGPWDDCFGALVRPPVIAWDGVVALTLASSCDFVVVYDERPHAVCVEPQTHPPDALNTAPATVAPGAPLVATTTWSWELLRG